MAVVIAGPTASGKSRLALRLAQERGGTVINADSMQVYRDLEALTARPGAAELRAAPHALYGHVDGATAHSVAAWLAEAEAAIAAAREAGRVPIVVGGSGLYLAALTEGLSPIPAIPPQVRARWRDVAAAVDPHALHAELAERDPAMAARLRPSDPQRIVRALEVVDATGRSLAAWQEVPGRPVLTAFEPVVLAPDRTALHAAIADRLTSMVGAGAVEEAARLAARGLDPSLPVTKAIGVRPFAAQAAGRLGAAAALEAAVIETRQYARRQETWFRHRFPNWRVIASPGDY